MVQCKLCGYRARSLGKLTRHRFEAHTKEAKQSTKRAVRNRELSAVEGNSSPNGRVPAKSIMSARDLLDILKIKRDALIELIEEAEKHVI